MKMRFTQLGLEALNNGFRTVSVAERQIMLLACGSASSRRMLEMMGPSAAVTVQKLLEKGLIEREGSARNRLSASEADFRPSVLSDTRIMPDSVMAEPSSSVDEPIILLEPMEFVTEEDTFNQEIFGCAVGAELKAEASWSMYASEEPPPGDSDSLPPAGGEHRSLNAGKLYVLSLLQTINAPEAQVWGERVRRCATDHDLIETMRSSMAYLSGVGDSAFVTRMRNRIQELVPMEHLHAFAH